MIVVVALLGLSILLGLIAYRRFPDAADRIVAADALSACAIGICLSAAVAADESAYIDVAIGFALVSFLATVGWSHALVVRDDRSDDAPKPTKGRE
jgi:multicomponent Na+:H+ antiporter subunit F